MATTINQAFIKQFECCSPLFFTILNRSKPSLTVSNGIARVREGVFTVTPIQLVTVFTSCVTVVHSGCIVRNSSVAVNNSLAVGIKTTLAINA